MVFRFSSLSSILQHFFSFFCSIDSQNECIICMERPSDTILPCAHSYCLVCIEQWKAYGKTKCPLCREPLEDDGNDAWVIPEEPDDDAIRRYLMSLADPSTQADAALWTFFFSSWSIIFPWSVVRITTFRADVTLVLTPILKMDANLPTSMPLIGSVYRRCVEV